MKLIWVIFFSYLSTHDSANFLKATSHKSPTEELNRCKGYTLCSDSERYFKCTYFKCIDFICLKLRACITCWISTW